MYSKSCDVVCLELANITWKIKGMINAQLMCVNCVCTYVV